MSRVCARRLLLRLRGGGKMFIKCRKCGNLKKKDGKPCAQPCLVDEYGDPYRIPEGGGIKPRPQPSFLPPRKTILKRPSSEM